MINENTEIFPNEFTLCPIKGKNIDLSFSGDRLSSDGELLLLRELDNQLNSYHQSVTEFRMEGISLI